MTICLFLISFLMFSLYHFFLKDIIQLKNNYQNRIINVEPAPFSLFNNLENIEQVHYKLNDLEIEVIEEKVYSNINLFDKNTNEITLTDNSKFPSNYDEILITKSLAKQIKSTEIKLKLNQDIFNMKIVGTIDDGGRYIVPSTLFITELVQKELLSYQGYEVTVKSYENISYVLKELSMQKIDAEKSDDVNNNEINTLKKMTTIFKLVSLIIIIFCVIYILILITKINTEELNVIRIYYYLGYSVKILKKIYIIFYILILLSAYIIAMIILTVSILLLDDILNIKYYIYTLGVILFTLIYIRKKFLRLLKKIL